jgi:hypothetical protein
VISRGLGDRQDDVARLVPRLDVAVRLDHMVHRVDPIDDRPIRARLERPIEGFDVLPAPPTIREPQSLPSEKPHPSPNQHVLQPVSGDVHAARLQRTPAPAELGLADRIDDRVVRLAGLREVLPRVVDDLVGAEGPDELDMLRARDAGDVRTEVLRQLDRRRAERPRRAVDQEALARFRLGLA